MTPQELVNKIDYEGGLYDAIIGWGLGQSDLTEATIEQQEIWARVIKAAIELGKLRDQMYRIFPSVHDGGDDE